MKLEIKDLVKNKVILLQGVFKKDFFDSLKSRKIKEVFVLEARPSLEAAKHSCRELLKRKIKPVLISDNMAGFLFYKNLVKEVCVSYQLQDKAGALCRIGSLILSVLGKKHGVPVYFYETSEKSLLMGNPKDIFSFNGKRTAPQNIAGYVPLVEWIPQKYITKLYE